MVGLLGVGLAVAVAFQKQTKQLLSSPLMPVLAGLLLFVGLGLSARDKWACTYDEGFHVTRGLGRVIRNDSRLSYYHPPLQNALCGWFANQAVGDKIRFPDLPGWKTADVQNCAVRMAFANRSIFDSIIRASRWGSLLFGILACIVAVRWAYTAGGLTAAWLSAFGMALSPSFIAHSNLTTTDVGVTALVLCASWALWRYCRSERRLFLVAAAILFALAAMTKFTGLIWMGAFLLAAILLAIKSRSVKPMVIIPFTLFVFVILAVILYGTNAQEIRASESSCFKGVSLVAGRYIEGLVRQSTHVLSGHRAYLAGQHFTRGAWWHPLLHFILKNPLLWSITSAFALIWSCFVLKRKPWNIIPFLPLALFVILFLSASKLSLGIRHLLPILPFAIIGSSVMISRLRPGLLRASAMLLLMGSSCFAVIQSYPSFISYYPSWAGGTDGGHRWSVDSNYDWGQDIGELEKQWASATHLCGGPPHLLYFGFVDPRLMYGMKVSSPSWCGYMDWYARSHMDVKKYEEWTEQLLDIPGPTVSSVSMLRLNPFGVDLGYIENRDLQAQPAGTFFLHTPSED